MLTRRQKKAIIEIISVYNFPLFLEYIGIISKRAIKQEVELRVVHTAQLVAEGAGLFFNYYHFCR